MEWLSIVEGQSPLWRGIPPDRRETIRAFLVYLESELLKRALQVQAAVELTMILTLSRRKRFNFRNASIGNLFISGCLFFFRSVRARGDVKLNSITDV